jgi:hypothetical protein
MCFGLNATDGPVVQWLVRWPGAVADGGGSRERQKCLSSAVCAEKRSLHVDPRSLPAATVPHEIARRRKLVPDPSTICGSAGIFSSSMPSSPLHDRSYRSSPSTTHAHGQNYTTPKLVRTSRYGVRAKHRPRADRLGVGWSTSIIASHSPNRTHPRDDLRAIIPRRNKSFRSWQCMRVGRLERCHRPPNPPTALLLGCSTEPPPRVYQISLRLRTRSAPPSSHPNQL